MFFMNHPVVVSSFVEVPVLESDDCERPRRAPRLYPLPVVFTTNFTLPSVLVTKQ
ncbi:hypothetical protein JOE66_002775 [Subtercola frigoramans]|uniref:Uncharacterized protein n=1 Tax=Subtercola frigoramans TaxID=120298 RepID=A0ABS2L7Q9_9MICO|nr:hypothetical protein [Subtercola frigoramans]